MTVAVQLQRDVPGLGRVGQIVNVSQAYARNFLLPKGMAVIATAKIIATAQQAQATATANAAKAKRDLAKTLTALQGATITLTGRASPQGKLFAAIKKEQLVAAIKRQVPAGIPASIRLEPEVIKTIGSHTVTISFDHQSVSFTVQIDHVEK